MSTHNKSTSSSSSPSSSKFCTTCGRLITWRKKWERNWDAITYCSDSCRKARGRVKAGSGSGSGFGKTLDVRFEEGILGMLREREGGREEGRKSGGGKGIFVTCEEVEREVLNGMAVEEVGLGSGSGAEDNNNNNNNNNNVTPSIRTNTISDATSEPTKPNPSAPNSSNTTDPENHTIINNNGETITTTTTTTTTSSDIITTLKNENIIPKAKTPPQRTRERCRQAARRLVMKGEIVITQKGKVVNPSFAKGVLELRLVDK